MLLISVFWVDKESTAFSFILACSQSFGNTVISSILSSDVLQTGHCEWECGYCFNYESDVAIGKKNDFSLFFCSSHTFFGQMIYKIPAQLELSPILFLSTRYLYKLFERYKLCIFTGTLLLSNQWNKYMSIDIKYLSLSLSAYIAPS